METGIQQSWKSEKLHEDQNDQVDITENICPANWQNDHSEILCNSGRSDPGKLHVVAGCKFAWWKIHSGELQKKLKINFAGYGILIIA